MSPSRFAQDIDALLARDIPVLPVEDLLLLPAESSAVALTFDDGFCNFETHAWPLLKRHALPVTLFVPTRCVGASNVWDTIPGGHMPPLPILDWEALTKLAHDGVTIGAHSRTHADLRRLNRHQLEDEVAGSVDDIEQAIGRRPAAFAYPYGYHNEDVIHATRAVCQWACTTLLSPLSADVMTIHDPFRLPRLDAYFLQGPAALQRYGSPVFGAYLALRAGIRRMRAS